MLRAIDMLMPLTRQPTSRPSAVADAIIYERVIDAAAATPFHFRQRQLR